jgi:hypothetical protein
MWWCCLLPALLPETAASLLMTVPSVNKLCTAQREAHELPQMKMQGALCVQAGDAGLCSKGCND